MSRDLILNEQRKAILMDYPAFKDKPEVLPTLGRIVFESDSEFAQKIAIQEGGAGVIPKWEQCSPYTQARFERMGVKIAGVLIEKCADQIDAMRNKTVDIVLASARQVEKTLKSLAIEDAEIIVEEKK
jgi:hypothetical protein